MQQQPKQKERNTMTEVESEMSNESSEKIPCLHFSSDLLGSEKGSEKWKNMCKKVREACESHGCFLVKYDEFPKGVREEMVMCMKELFDLPEETKHKYKSPIPLRGYSRDTPIIPLCQSFGIEDVTLKDTAEAFTNLMWPQGNPVFCDTLKTTSSKMLELNFLVLKMILESYGLPKHYTSDMEDMKSTSDFRMTKYIVPESNESRECGVVPHTDKGALTIICQNEVQGLQVLTKTGKWILLNIPQDAVVVVVGDMLKAWSNGRLHAAMHKVVMSGDKDRYAFMLFAIPKDDVKIEVPPELVDDKLFPLRYRPFKFGEFHDYFVSTLKGVETFAAV